MAHRGQMTLPGQALSERTIRSECARFLLVRWRARFSLAPREGIDHGYTSQAWPCFATLPVAASKAATNVDAPPHRVYRPSSPEISK